MKRPIKVFMAIMYFISISIGITSFISIFLLPDYVHNFFSCILSFFISYKINEKILEYELEEVIDTDDNF